MTITVENLVSREVHYCVSYLVSELCQYVDNGPLGEQAFDLASPVDDWEEAALQEGWSPNRDAQSDSEGWHKHTAGEGTCYAPNAQRVCEWNDIDPYQREVYEHWIVSDWLADRLAEKGEKVDKDFAGLIVWARTTTGQGIANDSVIVAIHADLVGEA